jgi:hypothetical protein
VSQAPGRLSGNSLVDVERFCFDVQPQQTIMPMPRTSTNGVKLPKFSFGGFLRLLALTQIAVTPRGFISCNPGLEQLSDTEMT